MRANELMLGDWVSHFDEGKNCVVTELRGRKVSVSYTDDNGKKKYSELLPEMAFEPIPLTAEILEKNGFVKDKTQYDEDFYEFWSEDLVYCIYLYLYGVHFFLFDNINMQIKYVHQLQHALRLCNIDKEIEL